MNSSGDTSDFPGMSDAASEVLLTEEDISEAKLAKPYDIPTARFFTVVAIL